MKTNYIKRKLFKEELELIIQPGEDEQEALAEAIEIDKRQYCENEGIDDILDFSYTIKKVDDISWLSYGQKEKSHLVRYDVVYYGRKK